MKNKLWLMAVCSTLLAAVASGQNAPAAGTNADSAVTYVRKGTELINQHKPGEALKAFEQASALQPDNERAAVGQYISLVQLNRVNDGAIVLDQWVAAKADDPRRWLSKGMAEAQTDRPEEALKSFEKLTELQPNESGNWVGKGEMLDGAHGPHVFGFGDFSDCLQRLSREETAQVDAANPIAAIRKERPVKQKLNFETQPNPQKRRL